MQAVKMKLAILTSTLVASNITLSCMFVLIVTSCVVASTSNRSGTILSLAVIIIA